MNEFVDYEEDELNDDEEFEDEVFSHDSWAEKFKVKVEHSVSLWIASAFVDMRAVDMLGNVMKNAPASSTREVRILLDQEFHSNPLARQAIINRLYLLPNVKIRLADTKNKFHPKFYIFNEGSQTGCLIGSMNFTDAAMSNNVEFGVFSYTREQVRECKDFFRKFWRQAKKAPRTEATDYPNILFNPGESVIHVNSQRIGCVCEVKPDNKENKFKYCVFFQGVEKEWFEEFDLERFPAFKIQVPISLNYSGSVLSTDALKDFIGAYLYSRYYIPASEGCYVSRTARIEDVWYQKIPLLKIASAPSPRLLIADEVGLGKTIEAGLILREMIERMPACKKIIILCPNLLSPKWQQEMHLRFNLHFNISAGRDVDKFLNKLKMGGNSISFREIIPYESLQKKSLIPLLDQINDENIQMDIVICDEAHHLRNDNLRQKAVRKLSFNNRCMLMLTATPINLKNADLHALLGILDPQRYGLLDKDGWSNFIIPNVYISRLYSSIVKSINASENKKVLLSERVLKDAENLDKRILNSHLYGSIFMNDHSLKETVNEVFEYFKEPVKPIDLSEARAVADSVMDANVVAQSITRTLKRDIGEFNVREVKTIPIQMKYSEEKDTFTTIVAEARKRYKGDGNRLAVHSFLRQASSCLPMLSNRSDPFEGDNFVDEDADYPKVRTPETIKVSKQQLEQPDSKYEKLMEIIQEARGSDSDFKVIVFCMFIKTIKYLEERINRDLGADTVTVVYGGIKDLEERYRRINDFAGNNKPNVLICSEIASEGIDLQFCHILINYDLPWNPTRVEQRIGRIDRFGQKADKVCIFNLVVQGTIEEVIYSRLGKRLEDARNTLGPIAEVLGNLEETLPEAFLSSEFNEAERKRYEKALELNLIYARKEQGKQEQESLQLTSIREEYRRQFGERAIKTFDHVDKVAKCLLEQEPDLFSLSTTSKGWVLNINAKQSRQLMKGLTKYLVSVDRDDEIEYYKGKLRETSIPVVFEQEEAIYSSGQFLSVDHPLVRYLLIKNRRSINKNSLFYLSTSSSEVPIGYYLIAEYSCQISANGRLMDQVFSQSTYRIQESGIEKLQGKKWLAELFRFDKWQTARKVEIHPDHFGNFIEESRVIAEEDFSSQYEMIKDRLGRELENARNAYLEIFLSEKNQIESKLQATVDPNKKKMIVNDFAKIEEAINQKLGLLPSINDLVFMPEVLFVAVVERR